MAYVYRHIRLDKNVPFYIGIGGDDNYKRATSVSGRNQYWKNIVSKTFYDVEILIDGISWENACTKEVEFISIYKRSKDGGTLANLTLGGEGQLGMTPWNIGKETPEETRKKQSLKKIGKPPPNKGKSMPPHVKQLIRQVNTGRPSWNKGLPMTKACRDKWKAANKGKPSPMKGKKHSAESLKKMSLSKKGQLVWNKGKKLTDEEKVHCGVYKNRKLKPVYKYDINMGLIERYVSLADAAKKNELRKSSIGRTCNGYQNNMYKGNYWSYALLSVTS